MDITTLLEAHQDIHNRIGADGGPDGPNADQINRDLRVHLHRLIELVGLRGIGDLIHILDECLVQIFQGSTADPEHAAQILKDLGIHYEVSADDLTDLAGTASAFVGDCNHVMPIWMREIYFPALFGTMAVHVTDAPQDDDEDEAV